MQEPQYTNHTIRVLMIKIAEAKLPCLSIMNMPPLPYLKRIPALAEMDLEEAYTNAQAWERFEPGLRLALHSGFSLPISTLASAVAFSMACSRVRVLSLNRRETRLSQ